ncbi:binding partner of ACD11 1-like [Canna indica]|uniref:Binding partner of ACD11 1-like n=1 Tax=Canna indica TaxID=4628 RepID=A0AAQ3K4K8_9LILI|nr:binding partner of ACD11 1-like [Canna indica]
MFMGALDLAVFVSGISPNATETDLRVFFSYCGTVDGIILQRDEDKSGQSAEVTFRQPYAYETALLLNGADLCGRPICILPAVEELLIS